jgi:phytoene dehydrogenase-like protein
MSASDAPDAIVIGAGVNGLVCALALARSGLSVQVFEERPVVGGVLRTEFPFAKAPRLAAATGAHRIGFLPPELARALRVDLSLAPREPSLFAPTTEPGKFLLAGAGNEGLRNAAGGAVDAMHAELDALVADLGSAWLAGPLSLEDTADRFVRPELREAFVALCRGSLAQYVARFSLQSGLLKAALAVDALVGSWASFDTPGSGAPLLFRHAARSRAGGGDAVAAHGLGGVVRALADAAQAARVTLTTGASVREILVEGNAAAGVVLADGRTIRSDTIVASADPVRLSALVGADRLTAPFASKIATFTRPGAVAKVNLALSALPRFTALPDARGQHRATTFLLPGGEDAVRSLGHAFAEANAGMFPSSPPLEIVFTSPADEPLHHASIVVPWAPYDLAGTTWAAQEDRALEEVLSVIESFAPGTRGTIVDAQFLHPKKLETQFGVTRGHLRHTDDTLVFGDRMPYVTPVIGLYSCSAACAPAGGMLGVAGHNAAARVLADFELGLERTEVSPTR